MNFSVRMNLNSGRNNSDSENKNDLQYFDLQSGELEKDSLQYTSRNNHTKTNSYDVNSTFTYPVSKQHFVDVSAGYSYNGTDNAQLAKDLSVPGQETVVDSLSRFFDYSYGQSPLSVNYRYQSEKGTVNVAAGLKGVGTWMQGNYPALESHVNRSSFNVVPELQLNITKEGKQFTFMYSADAQQPSFDEVQPVRDVTDPLNPVVGNPDLATAFRHQANLSYNQFTMKNNLSVMATISGNLTRNKVVRNQLLLEDVYQSIRRETRFLNMNGDYGLNGNYMIRKGFKNNKYNVQLFGMLGYSHAVSMTDNQKNIGLTWTGNQRLSLNATPNKWLEASANVSYSLNKTDFSLKEQNRYLTQTWTSGLTGRVTLPADFQWGANLTKNFVSGINNNITNNPLVINTDLSKHLLKSKELVVSVRVNDLLKQNNFVNRRVTDNGIVDSKTNTNSRFAIFSIIWMPQKWGMGMYRHGDGSLIRMR
ncbi:Outer membrane protein beta-barrel family protein [bacterium A37T11]|nr:Outer membrane protein beta-barrel family protein [bacterium A37T11]